MELTKTTDSTSNSSPVSALFAMLYEPSRAFAMLEPKRHAWLPLGLIMVAMTALFSWYFSVVDFSWFMDQMLAAMKPAERDVAKGVMTKTMMQTTTLVSGVVSYPIVCAVAGLYFMLAGKFINQNVSFGTGFALSAWASVPGLLLLPLGAVAIAMASGGQLGFSELNPLSVNQLFFQYDMAHPMAGLLDTLNATSFWSVFLTVVGFQVWAKVARSTALKVVLIPYVTIYAIWFAFAMSQAT
ncbi:MAG: YIP1 family protein [Telluria sp.]